MAVPKRYAISPLGHSADVSLLLHKDGRRIRLRQTCSTEIKLREDVDVSPGPARVEIVTDGVSHFSDVVIVGRRAGSLWVEIR